MQVQCSKCHGTGRMAELGLNQYSIVDCPTCKGRGHVPDKEKNCMNVEILASGPSGCRKTLLLKWLENLLQRKGFETRLTTELFNLEVPPYEKLQATLDIPFELDNSKPQSLTHQHGGDHYTTMPIQPWEIIDSHKLNFYEGNAIKYILRRKSGQSRVLELKKAIHYLEHQIEVEETNETK